MDKAELTLWCKGKEIKALAMAREFEDDPKGYQYFSGEAGGFATVWERLVFGNSQPHPLEYNQANEHWSSIFVEKEAAAE